MTHKDTPAPAQLPASIIQVIEPATRNMEGFQVTRILPLRFRRMVGPFIFVDVLGPVRMGPEGALDVRPHPHINLSTVTWLFDGPFAGAIDHRDSLGTHATIYPGQVNLMTAGRGITHSERTPPALRANGPTDRPLTDGPFTDGPGLFAMQTWLALPDGQEEIAPAFEAHHDLPLVADTSASARIIMGRLWGAQAPTTCHAHTIYAEITCQPGGSIPLDPDAEERAVILVESEAEIDGHTLALFTLYLLAPGARLMLRSATGGRVMYLGGEAFTTKRHMWWNFVSSRPERIEQAKEDWANGRFPKVPGDEDEYVPLPR